MKTTDILMEIKEDLGELKMGHGDNAKQLNAIIERLDKLNGRMQKTEHKVIKNDNDMKNLKLYIFGGGLFVTALNLLITLWR